MLPTKRARQSSQRQWRRVFLPAGAWVEDLSIKTLRKGSYDRPHAWAHSMAHTEANRSHLPGISGLATMPQSSEKERPGQVLLECRLCLSAYFSDVM